MWGLGLIAANELSIRGCCPALIFITYVKEMKMSVNRLMRLIFRQLLRPIIRKLPMPLVVTLALFFLLVMLTAPYFR